VLLTICLTLTGCAATSSNYKPSIAASYTGETATLDDTFVRVGSGQAIMFAAQKIDDKDIFHIIASSASASYGKGVELVTRGVSRALPIKPLTLYLVAQRQHGAPISAMLSSETSNYVDANVTFLPKVNEVYIVNGRLSDKNSAVWIEDKGGNVVSTVTQGIGSNAQPLSVDRTTKNYLKQRSKLETFLYIQGGESDKSVVNKLGQPDKIDNYRVC